MYPKLSQRVTAEGKPVYAYVCRKKEHSKRSLCGLRNANGNLLDAAVLEQIKSLHTDDSHFLSLLEKGQRFHIDCGEDSSEQLEELRRQQIETERRIAALVDSLADLSGSTAAVHVKKRIEELHTQQAGLYSHIRELESLTVHQTLSDMEFDLMRQLLAVFQKDVDRMTVEQKRVAIRTLVRKVVWDGQHAHVCCSVPRMRTGRLIPASFPALRSTDQTMPFWKSRRKLPQKRFGERIVNAIIT